jgi:hypothetical protein
MRRVNHAATSLKRHACLYTFGQCCNFFTVK